MEKMNPFVKEALLTLVAEFAGPGACEIVKERIRQKEIEGWTPEHDKEHDFAEMAIAASCYAAAAANKVALEDMSQIHVTLGKAQEAWPWDPSWDKRGKHSPERCLAIAGALAAAEMDRLRSTAKKSGSIKEPKVPQWAGMDDFGGSDY
jgi:hypothetical protein